MPIDTSMYNNLVGPPQPINPLGILSQGAELQGTLNQNRLFPLIQAQQQQATTQAALATNNAQLENQKNQLQTLLSYTTPLVRLGNAAKRSDVTSALSQAMTLGHVNPDVAAQLNATVPNDDAQIPAWLAQMHFRAQSLQDQFNALNPAPTQQQIGQNVYSIRNPKVGPSTQSAPPVPVVPSADTQVMGGPQGLTPSYLGNQPPPPFGGQDQNGAQGAAGAPQGQPAPGGSGAVGAGGLRPGTALSAPIGTVERVAANQGAYQNLQAQADNTTNNLNMLNNAKKDLGAVSTGRGTAYVNDVKGFIKAQAPWVLSAVKALGGKVDPDTVGDYDAANKWMTQYAQAMAGAHGGHTDYQQATTAAGNASTHIDPKAAKEMIDNAIALERLARAKVYQFKQENPNDPSGNNYLDWAASKWAPTADVRGATLDLGDKNANMKAIAGLKKTSPAEYNAIVRTRASILNAESGQQ